MKKDLPGCCYEETYTTLAPKNMPPAALTGNRLEVTFGFIVEPSVKQPHPTVSISETAEMPLLDQIVKIIKHEM